jgi:uroporphyrinogen-III synthase
VIRSILITKSKNDKGVLYDYCLSQHIAIHYHSFLTFKQVNLPETQTSDVLFFSSKRAVDYFLQQTEISENTTVACIGESTKQHLNAKGIEVNFVGNNPGQPESVSKELAKWLGEKSCTIVLAKESKKSILNHLNPSTSNICVVYETYIHSKKINQTFDCIVFTSPSNVEGYLKENKIHENTRIIAWGETTKQYVQALQLPVWKTLKMAKEEEVVFLISKKQ